MILVSAKAQEDNLGDVIIREAHVDWLSGVGAPVVSSRGVSESYMAVFDLPPGAATQNREIQLLWSLVRRRRSVLVFAPGEQLLADTPGGLAKVVVNLIASGLVRLRGGAVIKVGRGYRGAGRIAVALERLQLRLCTAAWSRDSAAPSMFPGMNLMPDIALASSHLAGPVYPGIERRGSFAFALRSDRAHYRQQFTAVLEACRSASSATPLGVVQVGRDETLVSGLADDLDTEPLNWRGDHLNQLRRVVDAYDRSSFVVSDRLHVLLFAARRGCVPIGYESGSSDKLRKQLRTIGLDHLVLDPEGAPERASEIIANIELHRSEVMAAVETARASLDRVRDEVSAIVSETVEPVRSLSRDG
ncbi:hypothetical protein [uncultured Cellulomonas sp.]|uniref:hypothetical protein n=1 Tax=uncultured Cellulomonas sp. TaxID=189682 RepID=UPI0028F0A04B|nr:hypothetical protein [uncultured Cellulomonas sp.]